MARIQYKIKNAVEVLEHFTKMHLEFTTDNYTMLLNELSAEDAKVYGEK